MLLHNQTLRKLGKSCIKLTLEFIQSSYKPRAEPKSVAVGIATTFIVDDDDGAS